ncbi:MAG: hypothetical protein H0V26_12915, partial [Solirubrobacterales bacterium]|nr:hypothetical protein [Solirubrobacterales bacterium]
MERLPSQVSGLKIDAVEWLPSGGATGLLRIRGTRTNHDPSSLPVLVVGTGQETKRHMSLPEPGPRSDGEGWRGAYILRAELIEAGAALALELEGDVLVGVHTPSVPSVGVRPAVTA